MFAPVKWYVVNSACWTFPSIYVINYIMRLFHLFVRGLDMSRFTLGKDDKEGSLYDLFAVANHSGTVNFGHYTAFGRLAETVDQTIDGLKQDGLGRYNSLRLFVFVLY